MSNAIQKKKKTRKGKVDQQEFIVDLVRRYDEARTQAKQAEKEKEALKKELTAIVGDKEELPVAGWRVTYRYDKDKEVEVFDELTFQEKEPAKYKGYLKAKAAMEAIMKKYVKKSTQKGSRRFIVERAEREE